MKVWEVSFSVLLAREDKIHRTEIPVWEAIDTYRVAAETIEDAIEKCKLKAAETWKPRRVRVDSEVSVRG